mmetsp:Transcript_621/g.4224  ORF Transcript_621/g.4224 Transcript_621/m.4224 type:complete len:191 (-) Transcript_621:729-1301(-)
MRVGRTTMEGSKIIRRVRGTTHEREGHVGYVIRRASKPPSSSREGTEPSTASMQDDGAGLPNRPPIRHSRVYLEAVRMNEAEESEERSLGRKKGAGNAVDWVLRSVDETLKNAESNPPIPAKMAWDVARGPMGKAAGETVLQVTKAAAQTAGKAFKVAMPVVGSTVAAGARVAFQAFALATKKRKDKDGK